MNISSMPVELLEPPLSPDPNLLSFFILVNHRLRTIMLLS
jgi:hypothetical protein